VRACADGEDRRRAFGRLLENGARGLPADHGIDAVLVRRHGSGDDEQVLAFVVLACVDQRLLRRITGGGHERMLIVQRDDIEHEIADRRLRRADDAFHASGAFLQLQPNDTRSFERLERVGDARDRDTR
jgi:hypothetical protein